MSKESDLCGLLKYSHGMNLGDTMQSLAAKKFLTPHLYFDRDHPSHTKIPINKKIKMMMNAYWAGWDGHQSTWKEEFPPSSSIDPLWTSCHFDGGCSFDSYIIDYFKSHEPIGCRDEWTLNKLSSHGVEAYFSNCLTITLENIFCTRNEKIYIVDVPESIYSTFPSEILNRAEFLTHASCWEGPKGDCFLYKFDEAQVLLHKYMRASLVITSRLHCATPCLGIGTPVVFIGEEKHFYRTNCLEEYIPLYSENNFSTINWNLEDIKNKTNVRRIDKRKEEFCKRINSFLYPRV